MRRRLAALALAPLVSSVLLVSGCAEVEQAATNAANEAASELTQAGKDVASQAAGDIARAGTEELVRQICRPVKDGAISASDQQLLSGLLAGAEAAGVPAEFTTPLKAVARESDEVPADSVRALQDACSSAG